MKIVISEFLNEAALSGFPDTWSVHYDPLLVDDRSAFLELLSGADALIVRNRTQVNEELLAAAPALKAVGRLGVGLDNIDMAACAAKDVAVHPATGANTLSVAEYVISSALSLTRGSYDAKGAMLSGDWPRGALMGGEVSGRTMGLWGYGAIARAVAERTSALGMNTIAHDPFLPADDTSWKGAERVSADALLERSDVLSLHVPLTDETRGMIGAEAIASMKSTAILINTARGGVVDETVLADALKAGSLGGAALDVFVEEPLTAEAAAKFEGCPNLILTPHIAGVTIEGNVRVSELTVASVRRTLES
ncbi:MAG: hydroxyacid dehydrogenase [Pseudomonadota bacterium]